MGFNSGFKGLASILGYKGDNRGRMFGLPAVERDCLFSNRPDQHGAHPASFGEHLGLFHRLRRTGREADHSPHCTAEVNNT